MTFGGFDAHALGLSREEGDSLSGGDVALGDEQVHGGLPRADDSAVVRGSAESNQVDERVEGELAVGALVAQDRLGAFHGIRIHESRPAPSRRRHRIEDRHDRGCGFGVEKPVHPSHAIGQLGEVQVALVVELFLAVAHPGEVELIAKLARPFTQPLDGQLWGLRKRVTAAPAKSPH